MTDYITQFKIEEGEIIFSLMTNGEHDFQPVKGLDEVLHRLLHEHKLNIFDVVELVKDDVIDQTLHPRKEVDYKAVLTLGGTSFRLDDGESLEVVLGRNPVDAFEGLRDFYIDDFTATFDKAHAKNLGDKS